VNGQWSKRRLQGWREKSFRETHNPLTNLKTAKSGNFRRPRYQLLSKTHDIAGETISFRARNFHGAATRGSGRGSNIWRKAIFSKKAFFAS
jgi:hypothetical protein